MTDKSYIHGVCKGAIALGSGCMRCEKCADQLAARVKELEAQIEAVGGVQALSAGPVGWKLVPVEPDVPMQIAAKKADMDHSPLSDWLVSDWPEFLRIWHAMLAASPTPPAEQPAQPGAVYAELPEPNRLGILKYNASEMRDFADRTHALRHALRQAAPQATPAVPFDKATQDQQREALAYAAAPQAAPAATQTNHPTLPDADIVVTDAGHAWGWSNNKEIAGELYYTANQMRDYVDADRVQRAAQQAAPVGPWSLGTIEGNWRDIDREGHGGVMRIVWRMEYDEGPNLELEAQAEAVVAALNKAPQAAPADGLHARTLKYIFGDLATETWERMLESECTPPLPLPPHAEAMGLRPAAPQAAPAVDFPDVEDMAHSAVQEALSCGVSHDVFHRWMRSVMDKTLAALAAQGGA